MQDRQILKRGKKENRLDRARGSHSLNLHKAFELHLVYQYPICRTDQIQRLHKPLNWQLIPGLLILTSF